MPTGSPRPPTRSERPPFRAPSHPFRAQAIDLVKANQEFTAGRAALEPPPRHEARHFRYLQGPESGDIALAYPTSVDPQKVLQEQQAAKLPYTQIAPFKQGWMRINASSIVSATATATAAASASAASGSRPKEKHALFLPTPPVIDDLIPLFAGLPPPIMEARGRPQRTATGLGLSHQPPK